MTYSPDEVAEAPYLLGMIPVGDRTAAHCLAAVNSGLQLRNVPPEHRTLEVCQAAVRENSTALEYVTLPTDALADPASGQLLAWLELLRACGETDRQSVQCVLEPVIQKIPLGKQYTDEWACPLADGRLFLDVLVAFADEMFRVSARRPEIAFFLHDVNVQAERVLRRGRDEARPSPPVTSEWESSL